MQNVIHNWGNLVEDVRQRFHEIFLRDIFPSSPINISNFILWHINLHSSTLPRCYSQIAPL